MAQPPNGCDKSWERPWSTEEMRQNADKWNLAADAGLLKHLQQFSQVVLNHTHSTEKALDSLLETINTTNTNINNVTNNFLCLANTQFLESRVYDDDEDSPQEVPAEDRKQVSAEGDLMTKVRSALSVGVTLLDTMFDPVDQNTSGVENDSLCGVRNRSPKNPYASRPLPHLIGSAAFMNDDNVGLTNPERETEQPSAKAPTMDDLSMYSDESILTSSVKRYVDDDSSNTSFCLGDDTPIQNKKPPRDAASVTDLENEVTEARSFADELAGKLAGMTSPGNKVPASAHVEQSQEETVTPTRTSKIKGDMFGVPHSDDEEDDALFSGRSGLFSGGRGLFDDLDNRPTVTREVTKDKSISASKVESDLFGSNSAESDEESDDLFAVPAKPSKPSKPPEVPSRPLSIGDVISQAARRNVTAPPPLSGGGDTREKPAETVSTSPVTSEKRIPVGGKSMFGSAGLAITKEALRRRPSSSSSSGSSEDDRAPKTIQSSGGGLPRPADEDDLFPPTAAPFNQNQSKQVPKARSDIRELSPESPGEDDLFATPKSSSDFFKRTGNDKSASAEDDLFATPKISADIFEPTGYDKSASEEDDLFVVRRNDGDVSRRTGLSKSTPEDDDLFAKPKAGSDIFKRTEPKPAQAEDDLFAEPKTSSDTFSRKQVVKSAPGEDDLFATSKSSAHIPRATEDEKSVKSAPKTKSSAGLFDVEGSSDEDNLFNSRPLTRQSLFSSVPPPLTKPEEKTKKVSLFDDSDSGDDEFLFSSASSAGSRRSQASVEIFNSSSVPVPPDKMILKKGLFDDDNLFSSPLDGPDIDIFRDVGNDSALPSNTSSSASATYATTSSMGSAALSITTRSANVGGLETAAVADLPSSASSAEASTGEPISSAKSALAVALPDSSSAGAPTSSPISDFVVPPSRSNSAGVPTSSAIPGLTVPQPSAPTRSVISGLTVPEPSVSSAGAPTSSAISDSTVPPAQPPLPKLNLTSSPLFDDDEDLFSVSSKPQLSQKPAIKDVEDIKSQIENIAPPIAENLFSGLENPTKDTRSQSGQLFGNIAGDDLFANDFTPSAVSDPIISEPKSRVDKGDGDLFVSRKPTLTISDSIVEDKSEGTKTKVPSVVVPNKQQSIIERESDAEPPLPARPPRTLDIRNTTDPSVISSFDDDDESEDLFKSLPKKGVQPKTSQMNEREIAEQPQSVAVPPEKPPSFSTCDENDAAKKTELVSGKDEPEESGSIKGRTPLAGFALNINPLALLPGAQPPSRKTPGEEPVGFDQPMENTSTLHSAQKERVRVTKRRPPSRRARQEAAKVVDHTGVTIMSPSSALSPSTDEDDLFGVPQDLPSDSGPFDGPQGPFDRAPILSPAEPPIAGPNKIDSVTVDDPLLKMRVETSSETETETETEDHSSLFAFVKKKPKESQPESLFSQAPLLPTKDDIERVSNDLSVDDIEDDGLFKPSAAVKKITKLGTTSKTWNLSEDDDDDLFSTGLSSMRSGVSNSSEKMRSEIEGKRCKSLQQASKNKRNLFDDDGDDDDLDDDDLFSCASTKPPPLPVSKGPAEVRKKSSNTPQLKDDLFDDPLSGR